MGLPYPLSRRDLRLTLGRLGAVAREYGREGAGRDRYVLSFMKCIERAHHDAPTGHRNRADVSR